MKKKNLVLTGFSLFIINSILAQLPVNIVTKREKGIEIIQKDSLFGMQFQFRMQNRAAYMSESETDLTPKDLEFRVRRLRMRLRGFVINQKIWVPCSTFILARRYGLGVNK